MVAVTGALSFAAIAVLVASRAENTQTVSGLMNVVMMPMFVLSGVFFSSAHFPELMQPLISILPLTALNDALRAVMIDGASLAAVARPLARAGGVGDRLLRGRGAHLSLGLMPTFALRYGAGSLSRYSGVIR